MPDVVLDPATGLVRVKDRKDLPRPLGALIDAVGLTSHGCTATHVGDRRVLTAGHCLETEQQCAQTQVYWGYLAERQPSLTSQCTRVLAAERSVGLDYALFEVDTAPAVAIPIGHAPVLTAKGRPVTMLGYPSGAPLHWSGLCRASMPRDPPGGMNHEQASAILFHQCPSTRGSSGSPIIDLTNMHIVGIHNGNIRPWSIATRLPVGRAAT